MPASWRSGGSKGGSGGCIDGTDHPQDGVPCLQGTSVDPPRSNQDPQRLQQGSRNNLQPEGSLQLLIRPQNSSRNRDSPPAWSTRLETRRHREEREIQMLRLFCPRKYRGQNKRNGFSERQTARGRSGFVCCSISSFSLTSSQRGCGNLRWGTRHLQFPQHFRRCRVFSVPLRLERSGW